MGRVARWSVGFGALLLGCLIAIAAFTGDPCDPRDARGLGLYVAPVLFGIAAFKACTWAAWRWWAALLGAIGVTLASGFGLFVLAVVDWAGNCTN